MTLRSLAQLDTSLRGPTGTLARFFDFAQNDSPRSAAPARRLADRAVGHYMSRKATFPEIIGREGQILPFDKLRVRMTIGR